MRINARVSFKHWHTNAGEIEIAVLFPIRNPGATLVQPFYAAEIRHFRGVSVRFVLLIASTCNDDDQIR
jgi:energy-converting hydrogenase Eha subunit H